LALGFPSFSSHKGWSLVIYAFENYLLDVNRRELRRGTELVPVDPGIFDLLEFLISNRERVVSKEDLIAAVWKGRIVSESTLSGRINGVRSALRDSGEEQRLIRTYPRKGFRFVGEAREERPSVAIAASLAARRDQAFLTQPGSAAREAPAVVPRLSIAVLPFANLSNDADQEYIADGLTDSLITDLSHIPGSFVIARTSAFTFKNKPVDAKDVGRELGVRYLVEGSVQKAGDRIRVNAQLVDAKTGMHLWAERYDRNVVDLFAAQDEITCRIALSLDVALPEVESQRALRERASSPDANDLVMKAWAVWNRKVTPSNIAQALQLFEDALRIDSLSIAAMVGLARMSIAQVLNHSSGNRQRSIQIADEAIARALDLDPRNSLAHLTRGLVLRAQGKLEPSLVAYRKAIEMNPNEVRAYVAVGESEYLLGRAEQAISALEYALRLDPREHRTNIFAMMGWVHLLLGRDDDAVGWFLRSIHSNPEARRSHLWLACAYALRGMGDKAIAELETFKMLMPEYTLSKNSVVDASDNPVFLQQRERLYNALRRIGVPD
jgi:TolB-like protein/Tfp pilus assembly protein PilF